MWSKDIDAKSKIDDYILGPFVANRTLSAAYPIHSNVNQYTYKLAPKLAKLLDLPEVFDSEVQSIKVYVKDGDEDEELRREIPLQATDMAAAGIEKILQDIATNLVAPHKLVIARTDNDFTLKISKGVRIALSNACHLLSFESTQTAGEWPTSIHYIDDGGLGKIEKKFTVAYKKPFTDQANALQKET